jgi:hypothetical protein
VEVFDIYGRKQSHAAHLTDNEFVIDISHLQAGLYFVKIETEKGTVSQKIIKQ